MHQHVADEFCLDSDIEIEKTTNKSFVIDCVKIFAIDLTGALDKKNLPRRPVKKTQEVVR